MVSFDISKKVAVITGGGGILCSVMAKELALLGVKVAVMDIDADKAQLVADEIVASGGEAMGLGVDVLSNDSLKEAKDAVLQRFNKIDILINGAGGNKPAATTSPSLKFFDMPQDALQWVVNLNLMGTIYATQVFGEVMAKQKSGSIINISSMAAYTPLTNTIAYSAAKSAISNFTQWMSVHFSQEYSANIRVNAIAPGFLHTQQNHFLLVDESGKPTQRGGKIIAGTPMGRYGKPEELIGGVVYLCSDSASFVTGIVLPIDGGYNAYSGV